jgi:putative FmdB family regulatory protein
MPFYEYECEACKFYTEVLQKITDEPLRKCPSCGKSKLKKLVSAPVFRLKGSGWYETDFKSDKENKRNLAGDRDTESTSSSEDSSSGKTSSSKTSSSKSSESEPTPSVSSSRPSRSTRVAARRASPAVSAKSKRPAKSAAKSKAKSARRKGR